MVDGQAADAHASHNVKLAFGASRLASTRLGSRGPGTPWLRSLCSRNPWSPSSVLMATPVQAGRAPSWGSLRDIFARVVREDVANPLAVRRQPLAYDAKQPSNRREEEAPPLPFPGDGLSGRLGGEGRGYRRGRARRPAAAARLTCRFAQRRRAAPGLRSQGAYRVARAADPELVGDGLPGCARFARVIRGARERVDDRIRCALRTHGMARSGPPLAMLAPVANRGPVTRKHAPA